MEEMWFSVLALTLICSFGLIFLRRKNSSRVPPGNFSLPLFGESVALFRSNIFEFVRQHTERFGDVFSTNIFGVPTIFVTTPEDAKFFLISTGAKRCAPTRIASIKNIVGCDQVNQVEGIAHARYRKIFLGAMVPEVLKHQLEWIDKQAMDLLETWRLKKVVNTRRETVKFSYDVITAFICEQLKTSLRLKGDMETVVNGVHSLPLKIPFTRYYKALQARKRIDKQLDEIITDRRISSGMYTDLLQALVLHSNDDGSKLSNKQIRDNMVVAIMAGHHTTSLSLLWMIKYLYDNPEALRSLEEEHRTIVQNRANERLTWEDTRRMPLTLQAFHETLRLASVVRTLNREIIQDVEHNGYLYPKGYNLSVSLPTVHRNEESFVNPSVFDPSRFQVPLKPGTYLGFGAGARICPGSELAKLEVMVFIHRLLTHYSWKPVNPEARTKHWPMLVMEDGYLINVKLRKA